MLSTLRKNQYPLTLGIVILAIVSFVSFYARVNPTQVGTNDVATVYGRVIQQAEVDRLLQEYHLAMALGLTDFVRDLGGFSENEGNGASSFIVNTLVIEHEAPLINIVPSEEAIATAIRSLPIFQTQGNFDSTTYATFMQDQFAPRGFTERHLEEIIRNLLSYQALRQIIVSPVSVSEAQVRKEARGYQSVKALFLRFDRAAYLKATKKPSAEEEKAFYEKNKIAFVTEERRAASYLLLSLPAAQQKLQGKEKIQALKKLANSAMALQKKIQDGMTSGKKFATAAKEAGASVVTTNSFNRQGESKTENPVKPSKGKEVLNASSKKIPTTVVATAFKLSKEDTLSEVIQDDSSFYIVLLEKKIPSQPLAFADVEPKIDALLREEQAARLTNEATRTTMEAIRKAMSAGKSFSEAATLAHQKVELLTDVSLRDKTKISPEQQLLFNATLTLKEGEMSDLMHAPWGDFIIYLQQRAPLSTADWEKYHTGIEQNLLEEEQNLLFSEWLRKAVTDAKITPLNHRGQKR